MFYDLAAIVKQANDTFVKNGLGVQVILRVVSSDVQQEAKLGGGWVPSVAGPEIVTGDIVVNAVKFNLKTSQAGESGAVTDAAAYYMPNSGTKGGLVVSITPHTNDEIVDIDGDGQEVVYYISRVVPLVGNPPCAYVVRAARMGLPPEIVRDQ